jgi:hypothetical protein
MVLSSSATSSHSSSSPSSKPDDDTTSVDVAGLTGGSVKLVSESERNSIELRQLRHPASDMVGVPNVSLCRHGWPQAALWQPMGSQRPVSGLMRLTCPHLVQQIDDWEREGAINEFNERLNRDDEAGRARRAELHKANDEHRRLRRAMMSAGDEEKVAVRFGEKGKEAFMNSGIAGMSPTKLDDVKCLHAQLADYLLRGYDEQSVGADVRRRLEEERGVSLGGCGNCQEQCNWAEEETDDTWRYQAQKNKSRLRQRSERRNFNKERKLIKAAEKLQEEEAEKEVEAEGGRTAPELATGL